MLYPTYATATRNAQEMSAFTHSLWTVYAAPEGWDCVNGARPRTYAHAAFTNGRAVNANPTR
jgi:uncharacterized protein YbdZ (MbtH family)